MYIFFFIYSDCPCFQIVYLVSFIISSLYKRCVGIGFKYIISLLVVLPITPDEPYLALNNPSTTRGSDSPWNTCEGTFFSMTQIYHWFLERSGISKWSWEARWSEKNGYKRNSVIPQRCRVTHNMDYHYNNNDLSSLSPLKFLNGRQTFMSAPVSLPGFGNKLVKIKMFLSSLWSLNSDGRRQAVSI